MEISPENPAINLLYWLEQMIVIAPINAEKDEAQKIWPRRINW
jgi:hypothetical protein